MILNRARFRYGFCLSWIIPRKSWKFFLDWNLYATDWLPKMRDFANVCSDRASHIQWGAWFECNKVRKKCPLSYSFVMKVCSIRLLLVLNFATSNDFFLMFYDHKNIYCRCRRVYFVFYTAPIQTPKRIQVVVVVFFLWVFLPAFTISILLDLFGWFLPL